MLLCKLRILEEGLNLVFCQQTWLYLTGRLLDFANFKHILLWHLLPSPNPLPTHHLHSRRNSSMIVLLKFKKNQSCPFHWSFKLSFAKISSILLRLSWSHGIKDELVIAGRMSLLGEKHISFQGLLGAMYQVAIFRELLMNYSF